MKTALPWTFSAVSFPREKAQDSTRVSCINSRVALSAWASYEGLYKDPFSSSPAQPLPPEKSVEEVEKAINDELDNIKEGAPFRRRGTERRRNQIEASFIIGARLHLYAGQNDRHVRDDRRLAAWEKYIDGIRKVSPEDVRRVAAKYLVPDTRTTGILIPLKGDRQ